MRRMLAIVAAALVLNWGGLVGSSAGAQEKNQNPNSKGQLTSDKEKFDELGKALEQQGGRVEDPHPPDPSMQHEHGKMIRPYVSEGGSGGHAPEEGAFNLAPGNLLELEAAIPKNMTNNLSYKVEDESIVQLLPTGVRTLVPVSMIAGEPKPVTGMVRYAALFQAREEGETTIHLTIGRRQYQYKVTVKKESPGNQQKRKGQDEQKSSSGEK